MLRVLSLIRTSTRMIFPNVLLGQRQGCFKFNTHGQPAYSTILWILLGTFDYVCLGRSHQDCSECHGMEINLSFQFLLNCASTAGSCHGGSAIHEKGYIPYNTCLPCIVCSSELINGFCPHVETTCEDPMNTCKT
jgi:hypothetical protein